MSRKLLGFILLASVLFALSSSEGRAQAVDSDDGLAGRSTSYGVQPYPSALPSWQPAPINTPFEVSIYTTVVSPRPIFSRTGEQPIWFKVNYPSWNLRSAKVTVDGVTRYLPLRYDNGFEYAVWDNPPVGALKKPVTLSYVVDVPQVGRLILYPQFELTSIPQAAGVYKDEVGNTVTHWSGGGNAFDRPLFIVEGIDSEDKNGAETYFALAGDLIGNALQQGADVFVLDFAEGGESLLRNGVFLEAALDYFTGRHQGGEDFVVAGVSMGGVIARLTLAAMEQRGKAHGVDVFVSIDAPQQGAIIDHDLLNFLDFPGDWLTNPPMNLTSEAGRQLLTYNRYTPSPYTTYSQAFRNTINGFNSDGYPHTTRNIGVSFANPYTTSNGVRWLEADRGFLPNKVFYVNSPENVPGSYVPIESTDSEQLYRKSRGGAFIPYASALDITGGQSRFPETVSARRTSYHDVVPLDVSTKVLDLLGYSGPGPASAHASGPSCIVQGNTGFYSVSVVGGLDPLSYRWELRAPDCGGALQESQTEGDASGLDAPTAEAPTADARSPEGDANRGPSCGEWSWGGNSPQFSFSPGWNYSYGEFQIRVRVTDATGQSRTSNTLRTNYVPNSGPNACGRIVGPIELKDGEEGLEGDARESLPLEPVTDALIGEDAGAFAVEGVYPNPTTGPLQIHAATEVSGIVEVVVYDVLGRQVMSSSHEARTGRVSARLDLGDLPGGAYILQISSRGEVQSHRVTVID